MCRRGRAGVDSVSWDPRLGDTRRQPQHEFPSWGPSATCQLASLSGILASGLVPLPGDQPCRAGPCLLRWGLVSARTLPALDHLPSLPALSLRRV